MPDSYSIRLPNPPARRAGFMLLALGGAALVLGGGLLFVGTHLDTLALDDAFRERLDTLRRELPFDPKTLFIGYGVVMLAYAAAALTLGALVRAGAQAVLIVTLVAVGLVSAVAILIAVVTMAAGAAADALLPVIVAGLHGWVIKWLIDALRVVSAMPRFTAVPHRAMEEYYLPPVMPARPH